MRPSKALDENRDAIIAIISAHRVGNARVFGSVALGTDTDDSDLDILVEPTEQTTLLDIGAIRHKLLMLLGVPVDVVTPNALPDSIRAKVVAAAREI